MKNNFFVISGKSILVSLLLILTLMSTSFKASAEPIQIRFFYNGLTHTPRGEMALRFKQLIQQRLGDDIVKVEVFNNSSLFDDDTASRQLLKGNIEFVISPLSSLQQFSERFKLFDLPFLFVTPDAAYNFVQGEYGARFMRLIEQSGFTSFGYLNEGMKQFTSKEQIVVPRDMRKLRMNIAESDVLKAQMNILRAEPAIVPKVEVYELLTSGELDGQESTWPFIFSNKIFDVQPFTLESNHGYLGYMILGNKEFMDGLSSEIRKTVKQSLQEALGYGNAVALENEQADRLNVAATKQTDIHVMTVTERRQWINAIRPVWRQFENEIGSGLISAAASAR